MRRASIARGALTAAVVMSAALAYGAANLDLTDFNDDVMKNMDDSMKALDTDVATHNAKSAQVDGQAIRDGLHWAEEYFTRKGNVEDAVQLAKQGEALAGDIAKSAASNDFDAALSSYDSLVKTCRRCHDAYKPPEL